ncbi:MAG: DMT family transporter [Lachnospiraceae bacterium]|nr:DMT family transporter [Lachnospiraceae bacterium]
MKKKNHRAAVFTILHIMLAIFSLGTVCSKLAVQESFLSFRFCLYYGLLILILGVYALGWQQIIKRMPLTVAYANRAVTVIWGGVFGVLFFGEKITPGKIAGGVLTIAGVVLYALSDAGGTDEDAEPAVITLDSENTPDAAKTTESVKSKITGDFESKGVE